MTAFLLLYILAGLTDINTITPILVSMIGLGVGIDYSLFIVTRFRQLLHDGLSPRDAAAEAGASAGRAVLFAGLTVAISVTGLAFIGLDFVTKLGIGSALGVLTTVLIANSLLPAVLAKLGHRIDRLKVPFLPQLDDSEAAREKTLVARWGRFVTGHARSSSPSSRSSSWRSPRPRWWCASAPPTRAPSRPRRRAAERTTCSPRASGRASTARSRSSSTSTATRRRRSKIHDGVEGVPDVASVGEPQFNDKKTVAIVFVTPSSAPQDAGDRRPRRPAALRGRAGGDARGDADAYVSGQTAAFKDIADQIMPRLPLFLLYIVGVTLIVLAMAFRSIVDLRDGRDHDDPLGVRRLRRPHAGGAGGPPARAHGPRPHRADRDLRAADRVRDPVRPLDGLHGLPDEPHPGGARPRPADAPRGRARHRAIGRVIVAAAIIMGTVFAAFILSTDRIPKEFGLLLAVAILTDALIVRMTLVPSLLTLLGERSWYIPAGWTACCRTSRSSRRTSARRRSRPRSATRTARTRRRRRGPPEPRRAGPGSGAGASSDAAAPAVAPAG